MANFFKQRSHYVFNYKPRFYDARKERIEALVRKYSKEKNDSKGGGSTSTNFRESWKRSKAPSKNNANLKTAIIIVILVFLVYSYFNYIGISFF